MSDPSENTADSFKNKLGVSIIAFGTFLALVGGLNSLMYHPNPGGIISLLIGIVGVLYLIGATEKIVGLINHERSQQTQPSQGPPTGNPLAVIRERYARGDIDQEEFERRLDDLLDTETLEQAADYRTSEPVDERSR